MPARGQQVIHWNSHETVKCPAGTFAAHRQWGRVRILAASGWNRLIEALQARPDEALRWPGRRIALVDVHELCDERASAFRSGAGRR